MRTKRKKGSIKQPTRQCLVILKAALVGCVLTVIAVLALALVLKWSLLEENAITVSTSIIKAICAGLVGLLCANNQQQRAWLWGGIGGMTYIVLAFISFSIVENAFQWNVGLLADIGMGFVAGIAGSMIVRLRRA